MLATGAVHLQQFLVAGYSDIPTIGTLFALNFAGATVLAIGLLAPLDRAAGRRGRALVTSFALSGIAIAAVSMMFLFISESGPLFGYRELGYGAVIVVALVAEGLAVLLLGGFVAARLAEGTESGRWQRWARNPRLRSSDRVVRSQGYAE